MQVCSRLNFDKFTPLFQFHALINRIYHTPTIVTLRYESIGTTTPSCPEVDES